MSTTAASGSTARSILSNDDIRILVNEYLTQVHQSSLDKVQITQGDGLSIHLDLDRHHESYRTQARGVIELINNYVAYSKARGDYGASVPSSLMQMKTSVEADRAAAETRFRERDDTINRQSLWMAGDSNRSAHQLEIRIEPKVGAETQGSFCAEGYEGTNIGLRRGGYFYSINSEGNLDETPLPSSGDVNSPDLDRMFQGFMAQAHLHSIANDSEMDPRITGIISLQEPGSSMDNLLSVQLLHRDMQERAGSPDATNNSLDPLELAAVARFMTSNASMEGSPRQRSFGGSGPSTR